MSRTVNFNPQGMDIVYLGFDRPEYMQSIEACCVFKYKGYEISISTKGRYKGACLNEHLVISPNGTETYIADTVQAAIEFVDAQLSTQS
ncbi:hypothetical protein XaC1_46 [Xanthomonas phage XaC1]|nr:hypothetical protein XaC1_46 [Xanthomonas phage XaC1]